MPDAVPETLPAAAPPDVPAEAVQPALDAYPPALEAVPRAPGSRATAVLEVAMASGFPTQLGLGALLAAAGLTPFGDDGQLSMTYLSVLMPADLVVLLAFIAWRVRAGRERLSDIFLGRRDWRRESWLGLGLVPVIVGAVAVVMVALRTAWPALHNVDANPFEALVRSRAGALIVGVLAVVTGGLKEEAQRAFVLHRFDQHLGGARVGLVLYSLVFGAGHVIQGYDVAIATTLLGMAWGAVFLWRRSAVAASVNHAGFNAAQVLQFVVLGA